MRIPLEIHKTIQFDDCNVIIKVARVELGMDIDAQNIHLDVRIELAVIVDIPLAEPYPQLLWPVLLYTMSGCQDVRGIYQRASADIYIVILLLLQEGCLPGVFS